MGELEKSDRDAPHFSEAPFSHLTPDDLQDLVVVANARTMPEALYLTNTLEDAGIPAAARNGSASVHATFTQGMGEQSICVPRALSQQAREIIQKARQTAEQRGMESAFEPDSIVDATYNVERDPVLKEMFLLREVTPLERTARLSEYIVLWLTSGKKPQEMAAYLAAADLTIEDAEKLVDEVSRRYAFQIQEKRNKQYGLGVLFIAGGIVLFVVNPGEIHGGMAVIAIGLALTFLAARPLSSFTRSINEDKKGESNG